MSIKKYREGFPRQEIEQQMHESWNFQRTTKTHWQPKPKFASSSETYGIRRIAWLKYPLWTFWITTPTPWNFFQSKALFYHL